MRRQMLDNKGTQLEDSGKNLETKLDLFYHVNKYLHVSYSMQ